MIDIKHRILIKFPTRGRPERFKNTLEKYINFLSGKHDVKFIFTFDEDDVKMNCDEIRDYLDNLNVQNKYFYGNSKTKIEAINANLENEDFDILILAADGLPLAITSACISLANKTVNSLAALTSNISSSV